MFTFGFVYLFSSLLLLLPLYMFFLLCGGGGILRGRVAYLLGRGWHIIIIKAHDGPIIQVSHYVLHPTLGSDFYGMFPPSTSSPGGLLL